MKAKIFVFFYTTTVPENEKEAKIGVLSMQKDVLEIPSIDLDNEKTSNSLQHIVRNMLSDTGINFDTDPSLVDIILDHEDGELDIYYAAYFPSNRLSQLKPDTVYCQDISTFTDHIIVRKFLCTI